MRRISLQIVVIVFAVAVALLVPPAAWIEAHYSNGFYPAWDVLLRNVTDRVPFSIGDVFFFGLFLLLVGVWIACLRGVRSDQRLRASGRLLLGTCAALAGVFIAFMVSWAYNYHRVPVKQKMALHPDRVNRASVTALADRAVRMLNANVVGAHAERYTDAQMQRLLEPTFYAMTRRLGDRVMFTPTPVKPTIFEPLMRASATYGFTDPWTHEINLSTSLSAIERPAAYAHEWSHLSGFADESEANFIAAISCIASKDPALRYSGWMLVWFNLPSDTHVKQRALPAVIADVHAIVARFQRQTKPAVERAQRALYGRYLKANNVGAGFESYRLFVQLITAGEFDRDGFPIVRAVYRKF
jgi:hypothetical protein